MNVGSTSPERVKTAAAAALTKKEKRQQALAFGALGIAAGPPVAAVFNLISRGTLLPPQVKSIPKWLAASSAAGLITSGAIPALQRQIADTIQAKANLRASRRRQRQMAKIGQAGRLGSIIDKVMSSGLQQRALSAGIGATIGAILGPTAATLTGDDKVDKDTLKRDMVAGAIGGALGGLVGSTGGVGGGVVGGLVAGLFDQAKIVQASQAGQDLRLPVMGGTKFPTGDSLSAANKRLSQSSAEVGPQPAPTYSMMGKMKKAVRGDSMDPMTDDPLVLFLKKAAVEEDSKDPPPLTGLVEGSSLKDNLPDMPRGKEEVEQVSKPPGPTAKMIPKTPCDYVKEHFSNAQTMRKKLYEKDHPFEDFDQGVVDRVLGL